MLLFKTPLVLVIMCVAIAAHIIGCFVPNKITKILDFVNLGLHSVLVLPLIFYGFDIDESVLLYLISATVLVATRFFAGCLKRKEGDR